MKGPAHWSRILAEGSAIVVSILLAFAIQAWWEGRQSRALEQDTLDQLAANFEDEKILSFITQFLPNGNE